MKDPDLLGTPNYTICIDQKYDEETKTVAIIESVMTIALWLVSFFFMYHRCMRIWQENAERWNLFYTFACVTFCVGAPLAASRLVSALIGYVCKRYGVGYIEKVFSVELRLYDNCAVKHTSEDRHEIFIQIPYENIRRCHFYPETNTITFTGRFSKVSFLNTDKNHLNPKYETVTTVMIPTQSNTVSEIVCHSPIEIYKTQTEETISENS